MSENDKEFLQSIATQLEEWAKQSQLGGWSTHQVDPMRKLADRIYIRLGMEKIRLEMR